MSIRRTIILLTVPLFLLLAMVNGALLYVQEEAEMSEALNNQALSAAITSAEFIAWMEQPQAKLAQEQRVKALKAAASHITGLDGLYLIRPGTSPQPLVAAQRAWSLDGLKMPSQPAALPVVKDADGHRYVVALAPASTVGFVAARIDAEPMFARMDAIKTAVLLIVIAASVIAAALAWFVARRIVRELDKNREAILAIGAGQPLPSADDLTIREARDLADAVRLMEASSAAIAERERRASAYRDGERTLTSAVLAERAAHFAPVTEMFAGAHVAARISGAARAGSFLVLCATPEGGLLAIGRCAGNSAPEALNRALAARRFITERAAAAPIEQWLERARDAYAIEDLQFAVWSGSAPVAERLLALADAATAARAQTYAQRNGDAEPAEVLDGIDLLLRPDGVFAAIRPAKVAN